MRALAVALYLACDVAQKLRQRDTYAFGSVRQLSEAGREIHLFHPKVDDPETAEYLERLEGQIDRFAAHSVGGVHGVDEAEAVDELGD